MCYLVGHILFRNNDELHGQFQSKCLSYRHIIIADASTCTLADTQGAAAGRPVPHLHSRLSDNLLYDIVPGSTTTRNGSIPDAQL